MKPEKLANSLQVMWLEVVVTGLESDLLCPLTRFGAMRRDDAVVRNK